MKNSLRWLMVMYCFLISVSLSVVLYFLFFQNKEIPQRKILVYDRNVISEKDLEAILHKKRVLKIKTAPLINAIVIKVTTSQEKDLLKINGVLRVEKDSEIKGERQLIIGLWPFEEIIWGMKLIKVPEAWKTSKGEGIKIAIIDTGANQNHWDLKDNIKGGICLNAKGDQFNDLSDDIFSEHGTYVAGVIVSAENSFGIIGVAPKAELYIIKINDLDALSHGKFSQFIAEGLEWCIKNEINIVNISLGTMFENFDLERAIKKTYEAGIVIVASAGNSSFHHWPSYPADYDEVIAVSAIDEQNQFFKGGRMGDYIDLTAPGVEILTTSKDNRYTYVSGTSFSAPFVSGVAALVLSTPVGQYDFNQNGKWDPAEVKKKLEDTATPLPRLLKEQVGAGLVNAEKAVQP